MINRRTECKTNIYHVYTRKQFFYGFTVLESSHNVIKLKLSYSPKAMSGAQSIVDAEGNINAKYLTKELKEALEADVHYRQTDNMKKRAVKVSTDYNEFKAMVACAHLKKLTPKEVESLSHVKKGWQKVAAVDKSSSALILNKELEYDQLLENNQEAKLSLKITTVRPKPKNTMEIERDLRRLGTPEDQVRYLFSLGIKKAKSLLSTAGDTDLLEQIVAVLCWNKEQVLVYAKEASHMKIPTTMLAGIEANSQVCEAEEGAVNTVGSIDAKSSEKSLFDIELRAKWFKAISGFDRFDLMVRFVSDALLANVVDILDATDSVDVSELKKKYCKTGRS